MSDLISRQDAINTALEFFVEFLGGAFHEDDQRKLIAIYEQLPSTEQEVIRCKDCKFAHMTHNGDCKYCDIWFPDEKNYLNGNYYCASAERKTDE